MKKFLLLILALFTMTTSAFAAGGEPRFDNMRTALVVSTTQRGAEAQYMLKRLREPFRIPYWDRVEAQEQLAPDDITIDTMRALSDKRQYQFFFRFDGEIVTDCAYYLSVYAYDRQQDTLKSYSSRGRERESASILNNPYEILGKAMDEVLAKLPYKRIPTDIEAVRGSISKLDVKTTEGGAKIPKAGQRLLPTKCLFLFGLNSKRASIMDALFYVLPSAPKRRSFYYMAIDERLGAGIRMVTTHQGNSWNRKTATILF